MCARAAFVVERVRLPEEAEGAKEGRRRLGSAYTYAQHRHRLEGYAHLVYKNTAPLVFSSPTHLSIHPYVSLPYIPS